MFKHIILLLQFSCFALLVNAQIQGSIKLGMAGHQGDVHSISDDNIGLFSQLNTSYGAGLRLPVGDLGLRLEGTYFHLTGDEREYAEPSHRFRGWAFENKFVEVGALLDYELRRKNKLRGLDEKTNQLTPVVFAGLGMIFSNPEVNFRSGTPPNADIDLQNGDNLQLTLPVGLGLKYALSKKFTLAFETGFRLPISDYYDGISVTANPDANDMFAFGGVKAYISLIEDPDEDADGVPDRKDDCPDTPGAERLKGCPDSDLDGVKDEDDNCPLEVGLPEFAGCPDDDGDGIINRLDACPDAKGFSRNRGCPDTDEDGVVDKDDACPELAGLATANGCPDEDEDGVADSEDECPEEAGTADNQGCPMVDADKDGVADKEDNCPTVAGTANGCPDRDKDGVADELDDCPDQAGTEANGCPTVTNTTADSIDTTETIVTTITTDSTDSTAITTTDTKISNTVDTPNSNTDNDNKIRTTGRSHSNTENSEQVETSSITPDSSVVSNSTGLVMSTTSIQEKLSQVATDIRFNTASATLSTTAKNALNDVIKILRANPTLQLSVDGYTDNVGSAISNQQLSERRAKSAYDYLIAQGISSERLKYQGLGEEAPIATNATAAGRYRNRRVELILLDATGSSITPTTYDITQGIVSYGAVNNECSGHPIFNLPINQPPRTLSRLGTNPEFGDSHGLSGAAFYQKLRSAHRANERDRNFLDGIFRAMGYNNGFSDATPDMFTEVVLPYGTEGNIGYSINHKTLFAKLNVTSERDLQAFRIRSANGCDIHFMKTCGNHMFF